MATDTLSQEVSKRAGWSVFMGILTAAVGAVMIIYPLATAAASTSSVILSTAYEPAKGSTVAVTSVS